MPVLPKQLRISAEKVDEPADGGTSRPASVGTPRHFAGGLAATASRLRSTKVIGVVSVACGLLIWELITALSLVNPLFLPRFSRVVSTLWDLASSGALNNDLKATGISYFLGLGIAVSVGSAIGFAMGGSRWVEQILNPWVLGFMSVPRIALIPILIMVFGIGRTNHVLVVVIMAIFPIILNLAAGVKSVDPSLLEMGKVFRVGIVKSFLSIVVPGTVPFALAGIRLAVGQGLIGVVVAEFFVSSAGIGHLLFLAGGRYDTDVVFAMVLLLALAGITITSAARAVELHFERWRP